MLKSKLRKKILKVREKFNTKNIKIDFNQIIKILKKKKIRNKLKEKHRINRNQIKRVQLKKSHQKLLN